MLKEKTEEEILPRTIMDCVQSITEIEVGNGAEISNTLALIDLLEHILLRKETSSKARSLHRMMHEPTQVFLVSQIPDLELAEDFPMDNDLKFLLDSRNLNILK